MRSENDSIWNSYLAFSVCNPWLEFDFASDSKAIERVSGLGQVISDADDSQ